MCKEPIVVRVSDRALFEPSCPDDYTDGKCLSDILSRVRTFYFRRVVKVKRSFWFGSKLVPHGEIWEPTDTSLFDVVEKSEVMK